MATKTKIPVKTKTVSWYDADKKKILFGIDVKIGDKPWAHLMDGKEAMFFETKEESRKACFAATKNISNHYNK